MLVYSISDLDTFNKINACYDEVVRVKDSHGKRVPVVLVGNKCDLEDEKRQVAREQGEELARQLNCPFFETSAKENICIDDIFSEIVRKLNAQHLPSASVEESKKKSKFLGFFKRK